MENVSKYEDFEKYLDYSDEYLRHSQTRQERRYKNSRAASAPNNHLTVGEVISELTDFDDTIDNWVPSYASALDPQHFERQWVINSVLPFYREKMISDVTRLVKGGKEANVYACTAHPATGLEMVAAKLYRPRMLRSLKNDAVYKAGRMLRDSQGNQLKKARRERLAMRKKTDFGKKLDFSQWIGTEFRVQQMLFEAGADVPRPLAFQNTTILMEYIGDEVGPAPALNEVELAVEEAPALFAQVMGNVALILNHHHVHGDLSAYNLLYWHGQLVLIDFPQMVEARHNPYAFELLQRDITRVCEHFARYGVEADAVKLTLELWEPYMGSSDDWPALPGD